MPVLPSFFIVYVATPRWASRHKSTPARQARIDGVVGCGAAKYVSDNETTPLRRSFCLTGGTLSSIRTFNQWQHNSALGQVFPHIAEITNLT